MNHPTRCVLCFGIILLVLAMAFAATASASSENASANLSSHQVLAIELVQPPPPPVTYTLTVNIVGSGTVTKNPPPLVGTSYLSGTVVALTAVPNAGWKFDNWSGDLGGSVNPSSITMITTRTVTANFSQLPCWTLTTGASPSGGGSVGANPTPNCGTQYISGTNVSLTASANSGYAFSNWTGSVTGSTNPTTVAMNGDRSVTANFATCYTLTTGVSPIGGGSVSPNPTPNCGTQYVSGTSVTLTANASSGYTFSNWTGSVTGSANPTTVTMNGARSVTANFTLIPSPAPTSTSPPAAPTATSAPTSTSPPLATITPLVGGAGATATITPIPSSTLPSTGGSPLTWIVISLALVLIVIGARTLRQSST